MHIFFFKNVDVIKIESNEDEIDEVNFNDQDEFRNEIIMKNNVIFIW